MQNREIASMLEEIGMMLSLDERPTARFEVRAYQKAALTVSTLQEPIEDIFNKGGNRALMELPGIGKGIAESISEYLKTGTMSKYENLKKKYPSKFMELSRIEGLGPKKIQALYSELGIKDIKGLAKAISKHEIAELPGFGEKSEEVIAKGLSMLEKSKGRILLGEALPLAESLASQLMKSGLIDKVIIAGSIRRMRETSGDIDLLALSDHGEEIMDRFVKLPEVEEVVVKGQTKTTVSLKAGVTCDLRVIPKSSFGAAVQYFTGSRDHNIQVRTIAIERGYKLNEYGLFGKNGKLIEAEDEKVIYSKLGMDWISPEMRESRGEVKLAQEHKLPELVKISDIKGDLHTHTKETDGADTIDDMAAAAISIGREYIATTNHTKSLFIAKGMNDRQFKEFFKTVDSLNERLDGSFTVLKGAEVDILKDGSLDLEKETLSSMDCVIASVHQNLKMDRESMTNRIVKAIDTGLVHILGHPTGRELLIRDPYLIDLESVFEAAERNLTALEINAQPSRLDLNDTNIASAAQYKIMFSIGTDAHRTTHLEFMRYGVGTARRGWLPKEQIINAMPLKALKRWLAK